MTTIDEKEILELEKLKLDIKNAIENLNNAKFMEKNYNLKLIGTFIAAVAIGKYFL